MATNYGQPPRAKPRHCFAYGQYFNAAGNMILIFNDYSIYEMPAYGLTDWTVIAGTNHRGKFYNSHVRHVFHANGKTIRLFAVPLGKNRMFLGDG